MTIQQMAKQYADKYYPVDAVSEFDREYQQLANDIAYEAFISGYNSGLQNCE